MNTLDRYMLSTAFTRWAMVLFLGVFLILLGDFVANMGIYLNAIMAHRSDQLILYFLLRFPEIMAVWLPLSAAAAGLLTAAPMLRQGTLIALMAAGVAPRRIFASLLLLALAIGGLGLALKDQIIPRIAPDIPLMRARMEGKIRKDQENPRAVGWREGDHYWCSQAARPEIGEYFSVAVFANEATHGVQSMMVADRLQWYQQRWWLVNVSLVEDPTKPYQTFAKCPLDDTGLHLSEDPDTLAARLKLDNHKTSEELLAANMSLAWSVIAVRVTFGLLPLLCLLAALPGFIHLEGRSGLGTMIGKSLLMTMIPLGFFGLLSRLLVENGSNALASCVVGVSVLLGVGLWRWWHMRM